MQMMLSAPGSMRPLSPSRGTGVPAGAWLRTQLAPAAVPTSRMIPRSQNMRCGRRVVSMVQSSIRPGPVQAHGLQPVVLGRTVFAEFRDLRRFGEDAVLQMKDP